MSKELLRKEALLQLVLDNIPSYVFWKDRNSNYLGCNRKFAESAGLNSPDDIIGKSDYDLPWTKEESDHFRAVDKTVMDSGKAEINFEESQTISNGSTRWVRTSKIPLYNDRNEIIGILGTYEDITERKAMELELLENNKNLQDLNSKLAIINDDLEQFTYATSHDLQEPLRTIIGFVKLLDSKHGHTLDDEAKKYLEYIKEGTQRMSTLTHQILSYSQVDKFGLGYEEIELEILLTEVLKELKTTVQETKAEISTNFPKQKIICQSGRLKMVFYNLIANGIRFNESEIPTIEIGFEDKEEEWHFTVSDNGIGISEDEDYIFAPFKRLNNRSKFPGNGIGLSICRRIVNLHGGRIWYTGKSEGTTFHFTISKTISFDNGS